MSPTYTILLTLHRATHVPIGDLPNPSSDPYLLCKLFPLSPAYSSPDDDDSPYPFTFRTPTKRKELNPVWEQQWVVGGVPSEGVQLKMEVWDEDAEGKDDRLGEAFLEFRDLGEGKEVKKEECKVYKRKGTMRSHLLTSLGEKVWKDVSKHGRVYVSASVLRKEENVSQDAQGRMYTLGPHYWTEHFSPLLGHVTHSHPARPSSSHPPTHHTHAETTFSSHTLQLSGPLPPSLKYQYVAYRPFIGFMFGKKGIEGLLLNRALRRQHRVVYSWDVKTRCGVVGMLTFDVPGAAADDGATPEADESSKDAAPEGAQSNATPNDRSPPPPPISNGSPAAPSPSPSTPNTPLAQHLLSLTAPHDSTKLYTYVLLLDGELRFTETGEALSIQFLSKHSMHSDLRRFVAWAGEFFVRPVQADSNAPADNSDTPAAQSSDPAAEAAEEARKDQSKDGSRLPPTSYNPAEYELVIDNDSGTYRPSKDHLPDLQEFLSRPENFGALGKVRTMDGFDPVLKGWKEGRGGKKKRKSGEEEGKQEEGKGLKGKVDLVKAAVGKGEERAGEVWRHEGKDGSGKQGENGAINGEGEANGHATKE